MADRYFFQSVVSIRQSFLKKKNLNIDKNDNSAYSIVEVYGSLIISNIMHEFNGPYFKDHDPSSPLGRGYGRRSNPELLASFGFADPPFLEPFWSLRIFTQERKKNAEAVVVLPKYVPLKSIKCIGRM